MLKKRHVAPKIRANGGAELIAIKSRNLEPSKNPSVTLFYFNAWSIFHKMDTIKLAINEISPSFVCVSESWLTQSIPTAAVEIRDFIVLIVQVLIHLAESCCMATNQLPRASLNFPRSSRLRKELNSSV